MKKTQETVDDYRTRLAKYFLTAYMANHHDVTFRTAQGYAKGDEVGELWLFLADIAIASVNDGFDKFFADMLKRLKEKEDEQENVISLDRVD